MCRCLKPGDLDGDGSADFRVNFMNRLQLDISQIMCYGPAKNSKREKHKKAGLMQKTHKPGPY